MLKKIVVVAGLLAVSAPLTAQAQYASVEQGEVAKFAAQEKAIEAARAAREQVVEAARAAYLGRKYWIEPNPTARYRIEFIETLGQTYASDDKKFVVTEPTSFVVTGFTKVRYEDFVQVTFEDGKTAYLKEDKEFADNPRDHNLLWPVATLKTFRDDVMELILPMSRSDLETTLNEQRKKEAAAVAAFKARGGVSIGMTAAQVRKSVWGEPLSINRTTGTYGVHEQWVYGGGNYVYLKNGRVTAIQN